MMTKVVAFETSALDRLQVGFDFEVDWFKDWVTASLPRGVVRIDLNDVVYFFGPNADSDSKLLVIDVDRSGLFTGLAAKHRPEAFTRLVRVGRSAHSPGKLPIPTSWSPYHSGSLISIQSNHLSSGERGRIEVDLNPRATPNAFAYHLDRTKRDLNGVDIDYSGFDLALSGLDDALLAMLESQIATQGDAASKLTLSEIDDRISMGRSVHDWLNGKLTQSQRDFVSVSLDKSIRLVGAAGTGKTLSLAVKCLTEFAERGSMAGGYRCLFMTHSQATVETVSNALISMDADGVLHKWPESILEICTLQELANEAMKYDLHGLEPLSSDGMEGRILQSEAIQSLIDSMRKSDWITYRARCSEQFRTAFEASGESSDGKSFAFELMNEFACVLEADGVRKSADRRERYINEQRKGWMMPLPATEDRRVVLKLYDLFRDFLRGAGTIGVDQMISDYLGFLDSNRWDNVRGREGFDVVFVDELHLFNRQERMTLHHLMRDPASPPIVVMAYDTKQSVRDTFYGLTEAGGGAVAFARDMGLGATERFDLKEGFRYTPEIARVLEWIDQTYPAAGISEELGPDWAPVALGDKNAPGDRPILYRAKRSIDIYRSVFPRAQRVARGLQKGRRVAVLCANETIFKRYLESDTEYADCFLPITDREQLSNLRHAGKRFVFSMPEFVAGIQFDTVFLIEANDGEVEQGPYSTGALRRFVSLLYLGASRAERVLEIYSSEERGGATRVLKHAIDMGALDVLDISDMVANP